MGLPNIRMQLSEIGVEMTPDMLDEVLQHASHVASLLGGYVAVETLDWGLEIEIDPRDPDHAHVVVYRYEDAPEEMN